MNFEKKPNGSKKAPTKAQFSKRQAYIEEQKRRKHYEKIVQKKQNITKCALATLVLASVLLLSVAVFEFAQAHEKYIYTFEGNEVKFKKAEIFVDGVQFVDMNFIADLCSFERVTDGSRISFTVNGTSMTLEDGSDTVIINSFERKMPACARITDSATYVPLQTVLDFIPYVSAIVEDKQTTIATIKNRRDIYIVALDEFEIDYTTDVSAYLEYINTTDEAVLLLANKTVTLDKDYEPSDLAQIPTKYRKDSIIYLSLPAKMALEAMMQDAHALGFTDVYVTSAYRSYAYQKSLFDTYVNDEMKSGLSYDEAVEKALTYSAQEGKSEHQTGLCVDLFVRGVMQELENFGHEGKYPNDKGFAETEVYEWLTQNAWKYGFILRYPEDKTSVTGYKYESWHYRFVGLEAAAIIQQTGLCFEEYLDIFNK